MNEMTELEIEIATTLAEIGKFQGRDFWVEVSRLLAIGEDWEDYL